MQQILSESARFWGRYDGKHFSAFFGSQCTDDVFQLSIFRPI